MDLERRIAKAKTALILEHPFFGNLAMNMPFELSEDVPTAATNGSRVLFNPSFCEPLKDDELLFLVAHEVCHPMLEHIFRLNGRDPKRWNYAGGGGEPRPTKRGAPPGGLCEHGGSGRVHHYVG